MKRFLIMSLAVMAPVAWAGGPKVPDTATVLNFGVEHATLSCALLSSPGDLVLQTLMLGETENNADAVVEEFGGEDPNDRSSGYATLVGIGLDSVLSLKIPQEVKYYHSEFIQKIEDGGKDIHTIGFHPPWFKANAKKEAFQFRTNYKNGSKRNNYSIYRTVGLDDREQLRKKESAMEKSDRYKDYGTGGLCSDFVNWLFDRDFTGYWNFVPILRQGIATLYPPEAVAVPDDIAHSPFSRKVCEIEMSINLAYPRYACTKDIVGRMREGLRSKRSEIRAHYEWVEKTFKELTVLDESGNVAISQLFFSELPKEQDRLRLEKTCRQCKDRARVVSTPRSPGPSSRPLTGACKKTCDMVSDWEAYCGV